MSGKSISVDSTRAKRPRTRGSTRPAGTLSDLDRILLIPDDADYPDTQRGGKAAREVYDTSELRHKLLSLLDRETLAGLLRLERAATASVAALLYREIHVSRIARMSRSTSRRAIYCDAVRILNRNPITHPEDIYPKPKHQSSKPHRLDSKVLLDDIVTYKKKYPFLHTIINDDAGGDDRYTVHLRDETIMVDLRTRHTLKIYPFPSLGTPSLPPPPSYESLDIRHSINLTVIGGYEGESYDYLNETSYPETVEKTLGEWKTWLFDNPDLDGRITSINYDDTRISLSPDQINTFLTHRKAGQGLPISTFEMRHTQSMTLDQFREIIGLLGPDLLFLRLDSSINNRIKNWNQIIAALDANAPLLQGLLLPIYGFFDTQIPVVSRPMSVLPHPYDYATRKLLPDIPDPTLGAWRTWLYCNPKLDPRVSSIQLSRSMIKLSPEEILAFIDSRIETSGPCSSFAIPPVDAIDIDQLRQFISRLGSQLRALYLCTSLVADIGDWQTVIALLDELCPSLQKLIVSSADEPNNGKPTVCPIPPSALLSGLPELLEFRFHSSPSSSGDQLDLARSLHRLGAEGCHYYPSHHIRDTDKKAFNGLVSKLRSSHSEYAPLHTIKSRDLDIGIHFDMANYPFEPIDGHFRRVAWGTTSNHATEVLGTQAKIDDLVAKQKTASESYHELLIQTTSGLADAKGDTKAEEAALTSKFEKFAKEQAALAASCQAMKRMAAEMEVKSRTMTAYARDWLRVQKEKK